MLCVNSCNFQLPLFDFQDLLKNYEKTERPPQDKGNELEF